MEKKSVEQERIAELIEQIGKPNFELVVLEALPAEFSGEIQNVDDILILSGMMFHIGKKIIDAVNHHKITAAQVKEDIDEYAIDDYLLAVADHLSTVLANVTDHCVCGKCNLPEAPEDLPEDKDEPADTESMSLSDTVLKGVASAGHDIKIFKGDFMDFMRFIQEEVSKERNKDTQQS